MSVQLSNLIHQIRSAQSIEEERHVITTELANIRTYIREADPELLPRIVAKLVYLNMLGENTSWGQLTCLNLMVDDRFSFKRIGYFGTSLLLDETAEVSVLLTHTIQKDLQSKHRFVVALALALLANIGSTELCRSLSSDVQRVLQIDDPFLRKRAAMAVIRIIKKVPEFNENFQSSVHLLLNDSSHSVVLSGITLVIQMLKTSPQLATSWSKFAPAFVKILKSITSNKESSDPFLQVKLLEVLSLLKAPSTELDDLLASILSSADLKRSDGRALLLQAVQTVVSVGKKPSLRTLGFNQIGRLLSFREANVLYSALNVFSRVLYANRDVPDGDTLALQRYKTQIVRCLDNADVSIRRRALDVISALIDRDNIERLVPEVLSYLKLADADFRTDLVGRIFSSIEKFSPNEKWTFDTVLTILRENGDIVNSVCNMIGKSPKMQTFSISSEDIARNATVQPFVQVAAWMVGEYCEGDEELVSTFEQILTLPQTTVETKGFILTCLAKLSCRTGYRGIVDKYVKESDVDLVQRAGEFREILNLNSSGEILAPLPFEVVVKKADNKIDDWLSNIEQSEAKAAEDEPQEPQENEVQAQKKPPQDGRELVFQSGGLEIYMEVMKSNGMIAIRTTSYNRSTMPIKNYLLEYAAPEGWVVKLEKASSDKMEANDPKPIIQVSYWMNRGSEPFKLTIRVNYIYGTMPVTETEKIRDIFN